MPPSWSVSRRPISCPPIRSPASRCRRIWKRAFALGGGNYDAPAQLVGDFLAQRASTRLGTVLPSCRPGVRLTDLDGLLPDYATAAIREAMPTFGCRVPGFDAPDAVFTAVETRTSSPVCIRRDPASLESVNTRGLYPAGEGAGYAGGIYSAAIDGIEVAEAVARNLVAAHTAGSAEAGA